MRTAKLDEIVRQKDAALKSAVELLATGQVSSTLDALQKQGRIKEIVDTEERIGAIARSYSESPERTLIVSPDNASRRALKRRGEAGIESQWHYWVPRSWLASFDPVSGNDRSRTFKG
jgi:hypothetical protein